jgi:hypothetical protein
VHSIKRSLLGIAAVTALLATVAVPASAETLSPWWGLTSGSQPTNLESGVARDEVQRLTVSATKGSFGFVEPQRLEDIEHGTRSFAELLFVVVPYNASAGQVQEALESLYPSRKVLVSGGPGNEQGSESYTITFPGQAVEPPLVGKEFAELTGAEPLSCVGAVGSECTGEAKIAQVAAGASDGSLLVSAQNRGDGVTSGVTSIDDKLPKGLEAVAIEGVSGEAGSVRRGFVNCTLKTLICTFEGALRAYEMIEVHITVRALPGASTGEQNSASISGGGAPRSVSASHPIEVNGREKFGFEDYEMIPENFGGSIDTQAGSHPFQLTTVVTLNSRPSPEAPRAEALSKDVITELPAGLVGNPTPLPQCTDKQFETLVEPESKPYFWNQCPPQSAIGVAIVSLTGSVINKDEQLIDYREPIFNMQPLPGEPARFGFKVGGLVPVYLDTSVRTGSDYGVTVSSTDISQIDWLLGVKLTFWGVPGDPRHDNARGWACIQEVGACASTSEVAPPPFLGLPTSCEQPFQTTVRGDSWGASSAPAQQAEPVTYRLPAALDGCNHLPFAPSITVAPDVPDASSATGLTVGVHVPQTATLNANGLAESTLRNTTVALPEGVSLNPAGADGLEACGEEQIGFTGVEAGSGNDLFTDGMPEPFCPDASKIGTVKIKTPLLPNALEGAVYLAAQNANPFGSLVAMYLVAKDPVSGVLVKLPGMVRLDERTGRIVATFENTPELPFEDLELHFFGGERAPLGTPALCGTYTTEAAFTPWSGNPAAHPTSSFEITSGPNGKPCAAPPPFAPSLTAGTTSIQAGGFTPFTMTMGREDGNQNLSAIELHMPPGMLGTLSTVKLCGEAQADAGTCGRESLIGETIVSVGLGGEPYSVTGGKVYITGPYKGAPFGLSIVNPAQAGPFNLGQVVVRAKIEVDPVTAALTIVTDSEGPYKIPTIIDGIPLQIKHINVSINRPNFTFNPTNCSSLAITGRLLSAEGSSSALSVPFQVTNCAVLAFKPKLTASTSGRTSRARGASLTVKLGYPAGPYDANIARVKVELPKQLPSQLKTLQKACTAQVFEANPANCPAASIIGHATATTPVLPVPLSGPAYFVSHGGEAFPSLIIVLQGYGVTVHLVGSTFISKTGITSSTFKTVPDVPVGSFELTLPQGPYSALTANANLCKSKLAMPTEFVGQNGALIKTSTKIAVTGCLKAKKTAKGKAARGRGHGKRANSKRKQKGRRR